MTAKKSVRVNDILAQNRAATRDELNNLYLQVVCETTCIDVIELMSEKELKRLLAIRLLQFWLSKGHNKSLVVSKASKLLGVHRATLYDYINKYHG